MNFPSYLKYVLLCFQVITVIKHYPYYLPFVFHLFNQNRIHKTSPGIQKHLSTHVSPDSKSARPEQAETLPRIGFSGHSVSVTTPVEKSEITRLFDARNGTGNPHMPRRQGLVHRTHTDARAARDEHPHQSTGRASSHAGFHTHNHLSRPS